MDGHISEDSEGSPSTTRSAKNPIERVRRNDAGGGSSSAGALEATIANLGKPVEAEVDLEKTQAKLEEHCQWLLQKAKEVAQIQTELDRSMREYDAAHNFTPAPMGPSRLGQV